MCHLHMTWLSWPNVRYEQSLAVEFPHVANPFAWASQFSALVDMKSVVLLLLYGDEMRPYVSIDCISLVLITVTFFLPLSNRHCEVQSASVFEVVDIISVS